MPKPSPTGVKRKVRQSGATRRPREREHLTPKEVERVFEAARKGRWGLRGATLLLMLFSHGLRLAEALRLRWNHLELDQGVLHLRRLKNGLDGDHRLRGVEIRALRQMRRLNPHPAGDYVFTSERGAPLGSRTVQLMLDRAAARAGLEHLNIHPHFFATRAATTSPSAAPTSASSSPISAIAKCATRAGTSSYTLVDKDGQMVSLSTLHSAGSGGRTRAVLTFSSGRTALTH